MTLSEMGYWTGLLGSGAQVVRWPLGFTCKMSLRKTQNDHKEKRNDYEETQNYYEIDAKQPEWDPQWLKIDTKNDKDAHQL